MDLLLCDKHHSVGPGHDGESNSESYENQPRQDRYQSADQDHSINLSPPSPWLLLSRSLIKPTYSSRKAQVKAPGPGDVFIVFRYRLPLIASPTHSYKERIRSL